MSLYCLLRNGELIRPGDESLADDCETWQPVEGWIVGATYNPGVLVPMRRCMDRERPQAAEKIKMESEDD